MLDVAGASGLGDSLVPALLGDEFESYACSEMLVRDTPSAEQRMIVGPDLKKLVQYGNGASEVYRLADDPGEGRALGVGEVKFTGEITPDKKLVRYVIDIKRVRRGKLNLGIADGRVYVDDEHVYTALDMKVGLKNVL